MTRGQGGRIIFFGLVVLPCALSCSGTKPSSPLEWPVTSAWYAETDDFAFHGTQFYISGRDSDPVDWSRSIDNAVLGIATTEDPARISERLTAQVRDHVDGSGTVPSVGRADPGAALAALAKAFRNARGVLKTGGTYPNVDWGDLEEFQLIRVTGDLDLPEGGSGGGILVVEGNLTCTAAPFTWYGVILVLGGVRFEGKGQGVHLFGALLSGGGRGSQTIAGQVDIFYSSDVIQRVNAFSAALGPSLPRFVPMPSGPALPLGSGP